MSSLKYFIMAFFLLNAAHAESCMKIPDHFRSFKAKGGQLSYVNEDESVIFSFKCDKSVKRETAMESLSYFQGVQKLNENTFYYELKKSGDSLARIYINWSPDLGMRNFAFVSKNRSEASMHLLYEFEAQLR